MKSHAHFPQWLSAFLPDALHTRPREWSRAAFGAAAGFLFSTWVCSQLFGLHMAVHFSGPLAASAVLLFAVSSGALAQPWSILGSYLCASAVALTISHFIDHSLLGAALALGLSLLLMCPLRCLHPPGGAIAFCMVFATPLPGDPFWQPALVAMTAGVGLLACALLYNNLTRVPYPRPHPGMQAVHHTHDPLPSERAGINAGDLDHALDELGSFVDITREDLELIVRSTEKHALRRSMGEIRAGQMMSRDLVYATPQTAVAKGLYLLTHHGLKALPILDAGRLVGIVSLVDLVSATRANSFNLRAILGLQKRQVLGEVMTTPVRTVNADTHVVDLIALLSDEGLHCLPVLDDGRLVGVITQTDLVAALHRDLLRHLD